MNNTFRFCISLFSLVIMPHAVRAEDGLAHLFNSAFQTPFADNPSLESRHPYNNGYNDQPPVAEAEDYDHALVCVRDLIESKKYDPNLKYRRGATVLPADKVLITAKNLVDQLAEATSEGNYDVSIVRKVQKKCSELFKTGPVLAGSRVSANALDARLQQYQFKYESVKSLLSNFIKPVETCVSLDNTAVEAAVWAVGHSASLGICAVSNGTMYLKFMARARGGVGTGVAASMGIERTKRLLNIDAPLLVRMTDVDVLKSPEAYHVGLGPVGMKVSANSQKYNSALKVCTETMMRKGQCVIHEAVGLGSYKTKLVDPSGALANALGKVGLAEGTPLAGGVIKMLRGLKIDDMKFGGVKLAGGLGLAVTKATGAGIPLLPLGNNSTYLFDTINAK